MILFRNFLILLVLATNGIYGESTKPVKVALHEDLSVITQPEYGSGIEGSGNSFNDYEATNATIAAAPSTTLPMTTPMTTLRTDVDPMTTLRTDVDPMTTLPTDVDPTEMEVESLGETSVVMHIHTDAYVDMVELVVVSREEIVASPLVVNELLGNMSNGPQVQVNRRMYITAVFIIQEGYDATFIIGDGVSHSACGFTFGNPPLESSTTYFTTVIYVRRQAMERYGKETAETTKPTGATRRGCIRSEEYMFRNSRSFRTRFRYHTMIYAVLMISMLIATMCLAIFLIRVMCDIMAGSMKTKTSKPKVKEVKVKDVKEVNFKHDNMKLVFTSNRPGKDDKDLLVDNMLV